MLRQPFRLHFSPRVSAASGQGNRFCYPAYLHFRRLCTLCISHNSRMVCNCFFNLFGIFPNTKASPAVSGSTGTGIIVNGSSRRTAGSSHSAYRTSGESLPRSLLRTRSSTPIRLPEPTRKQINLIFHPSFLPPDPGCSLVPQYLQATTPAPLPRC